VFRDFEQVQNAKESGLARQFRSNIWKPYRLNRIDLNLAFLYTVPRPYSTWGRVQILTLQVISSRRTPSRSRLVNVMNRVYENTCQLSRNRKLSPNKSPDSDALIQGWSVTWGMAVRNQDDAIPRAALA
jgi:hypothetical protein